MAVNQQRYRQLQFERTEILEARELNWTQEIAQGVSLAAGGGGGLPVSNQLPAVYRQGALFNVTVVTAGLTVTLSATDALLPMMVFVRDRWETIPTTNDTFADHLSATVGANAVFHLQSSETTIYLSWQLFQQTGGITGTDPTLSDSSGNPTANAGELQLALSTLSGVGSVVPGAYYGLASGGSIIAVNTSLIPSLTFTNNGTTLTYVAQDNILAQALARPGTSGFVSVDTSHGGSGSLVVPTDDDRIGAALTSVADGLVHDSTVRTPVAFGGTNADGTPVYKLPTDGGSDIGGVSAAKVIMISFTQTLEAGWNYLRAAFSSLLAAFNAHYTAQLGLANTHPVPTPSQVGAAPAIHVGQPLGTVGSAQAAASHPGVISTTTGGFQVNQSVTGAALDPAYGVFTAGTDIASLNHDGDIFSNLAKALTVSGVSAPASTTGNLGLISTIAKVLSQHVNQNASAGHFNPHNTTVASLNAGITLSSQSVSNGTVGVNNTTGKYVILTFANGGTTITVALGTGTAFSKNTGGDFGAGTNFTIPLPTGGFTVANTISGIALQQNSTDDESYGTSSRYQFWATRSNFVSGLTYNMTSWKIDSDGSARHDCDAIATWHCVAWIG